MKSKFTWRLVFSSVTHDDPPLFARFNVLCQRT
ncbi:hypothetical protein T4C_10980 [Trichinella pseudospiralis]|uniref:Uncharacterized protein n=1 Tax=Trichinella pseudospiralis TaxID=6337 RepID=A0A0V1GI44_TRIPS|nr:hypothetical protein T4C_10980 [Trichinella pseudospiralis]